MRGRYLVLMFMVSVIASLGAGFFLGANYNRNQNKKATAKNISTVSDAVTTSSPASTNQSPVASPSASGDSQTYTIKKGDTLYSIGKQFNMQWTVLAKANSMDENTVLKDGQVIKIPSQAEAATIQSQTYDVVTTSEETQSLQDAQNYAKAGTGQLAYRMDPVQVVQKSPLLSRFQFTLNDLFVEKTKDIVKGEATVEVTHAGKLYTIYLTQPLDKGDKGVWTPTKVTY